jgi:hypothetical protein
MNINLELWGSCFYMHLISLSFLFFFFFFCGGGCLFVSFGSYFSGFYIDLKELLFSPTSHPKFYLFLI